MSVLRHVEEMIGPLDRWPAYIIFHLFSSVPDDRVTKQVAAFLYGNGVCLETATACYLECRGREHMQIITDGIYSRYQKWKRNPVQNHKAMYYDMHTGHMKWINGRENAVRPDVTVPDIGLAVFKQELPKWEWTLRCAIEYIRAKS